MNTSPRLLFTAENTVGWLILTLGVVFGGSRATLAAGSPVAPNPEKGRPSVLIVTLDTTRADKLGCYGSRDGLTPSLDAFARKCALFRRCEAGTPMTLPSHTTIMSGWTSTRHGVRGNVGEVVPPDVPLLAEAFSGAGYQTAAFVSSIVLLGRYGLKRGFGLYDERFHDQGGRLNPSCRAEQTLGNGLEWIRSAKRPFLCWIHLYDPHEPYDPPEPFQSRYRGKPYDGEIAYMDGELGKFFQALDGAGALDDLVVVVVADHGESLGEHGEATHGVFLYEAATWVPLLIRLPGQKAGPSQNGVDGLVSLTDLAPTLRELCGLPAVSSDGFSLAPLLRGRSSPPRPAFLESLSSMLTFGWAPLYGVVRDRWKFILAPREELYDLAKDPREATNLITREKKMAAELRRTLLEHREAVEKVSRPAQKAKVEDRDLQALAGLGYIGAQFGGESASNLDPKDFIKLVPKLERATGLVQGHKYEQALSQLQECIETNPGNSVIFHLMGICYAPSDREKAISCWKQSAKLCPSNPNPWSQWIHFLLRDGKIIEAATVGQTARSVCEDSMGYFNLALAEKAVLEKRPDAEAMALVEAALRLNGELGRAHLLKGLLLSRKGAGAESRAEASAAMRFIPPGEKSLLKKDPVLGVFAGEVQASPGRRDVP